MGKQSKPWLNYGASGDEKYVKPETSKTIRSYKRALFYLLVFGFAGAHKFYLYDEKQGWKMFGFYMVIAILTAVLFYENNVARFIAFMSYVLLVVIFGYPKLEENVERINQDIIND